MDFNKSFEEIEVKLQQLEKDEDHLFPNEKYVQIQNLKHDLNNLHTEIENLLKNTSEDLDRLEGQTFITDIKKPQLIKIKRTNITSQQSPIKSDNESIASTYNAFVDGKLI